MKKKFSSFFARWYVIVGFIALIIIASIVLFGGNGKNKFETAEVKIGDVIERVSVTGKVLAVDKADLAFEKGGVISSIAFKVGDNVSRGQVISSLGSATDIAQLRSAEAKLQEITRSLRPEELGVEKARVDSAKSALESEKREANEASRNSYVQAQASLLNNLDQFFNFPQSVNPQITIRTESADKEREMNSFRFKVTETLNEWKLSIDSAATSSNGLIALNDAQSRLDVIKSFISSMSVVINDLDIRNSGLSQTIIDGYIVSANTAMSEINSAVGLISQAKSQLNAATTAYDEAQNNFVLKNSGSSNETKQAEQATVDQFRAEVEKNYIRAPFDGVITRIDPSVGEFVAGGTSVITIVSDGQFKIETNIPEADIAKISKDNIAGVTLDAYADHDFEAKVSFIDPAETVIDGVPTYKVTLHFQNTDTKIRSGMTANVDIETRRRDDVVFVPQRAIVDEDGTKVVRIVNSDGKTWRSSPVSIGLRGSDGMVEIISGVEQGDLVIININK